MAVKPKIICVGANIETDIALRGLIKIDANIIGLITLPLQKSSHVSDYIDLHNLCNENNITVIDTLDINSIETLTKIKKLKPDYIFTLGWSQIFNAELLNIPNKYVVGSHPSLLPEGRGRAPVPWTIIQEYNKGAVTLFRMDSGIDSGNILIQRKFDIPPRAYAMDLYMLTADNLCKAYCTFYKALENGTVGEICQNESKATYRSKRIPADGHINFSKTAKDIDKLIRAVSEPYPGAYTYYKGQMVNIWRSSLDAILPYKGTIGQILVRKEERLLVQACDHPIWIWNLTIQGKSINIKTFVEGSKFGYAVEDEIHFLRQELEYFRRKLSA